MQLSDKKIKEIFQKYQQSFQEMEHYDRTREKLWAKKRIDITLTCRIIKKLKALSKSTKKSVSQLIEEAFSKL